MFNGKTKSGFEYSIDSATFDDYELLEAIHMVDKGSRGHMVDVVNILLGEEQKKALMEHLRENGRVKMSTMFETVMEIFQNHKEGKN